MSSAGRAAPSIGVIGRICTAFIVAVALSACGTPLSRTSTGVDEVTQLVIVADSLIGAEVYVNDRTSGPVARTDLQPYRYGIWSSRNKREQSLDRIVIAVESGDNAVRVVKDGRTIYERTMHFLHGQTREIEI